MNPVPELPQLEQFVVQWHETLADWLSGRSTAADLPETLTESLHPEFRLIASDKDEPVDRDALIERLADARETEGHGFQIDISELRAFPHGALVPGSSLLVVSFREHRRVDEVTSSIRRARCIMSANPGSQGPEFRWHRVEERREAVA